MLRQFDDQPTTRRRENHSRSKPMIALAVAFLIMVSLLPVTRCQQKRRTETPSEEKLKSLRRMLKASPTYTIPLTLQQYDEFVNNKPRAYTCVVFFYQNGPEDHQEALLEYQKVAKQFQPHQVHLTRKSGDKIERPIFFMSIVVSNPPERHIFKDLPIRETMALLVSTGLEVEQTKDIRSNYFLKNMWIFMWNDGYITGLKMANYINARLPIQIEYQEPIEKFLKVFGILVLGGAVAAFLYIKLFWLFSSPKMLLLVFFIGYFISSSCFIWTQLNDGKWTGIKDDKPEYIFPSTGMQHISEGFLVGGLIIGIAISLGLVLFSSYKLDNWLLRRILSYAFLAAAVYMFIQLEEIYRFKRGWYFPVMNPPEHYKRGSIRQDQGHTV